jgi:1-acyl-sn-glycerol-3-phosphate acyltransferase
MDLAKLHERTRQHGARPWVYWPIRLVIQTFCHVYFRMRRMGRWQIPRHGAAIVASNHRSFLDPFVVGTMAKRQMYYVAKREIFEMHPVIAWLMSSVGAFPVSRGYGDKEMMETARQLLDRGEVVLIFPEGTRRRPGPLGKPRRGCALLALECGVPVIPVAVNGTEAIRNGWRIRPHKVRAITGSPIPFPRVEHPDRDQINAAADAIWREVNRQWEWLGGAPAAAGRPWAATPSQTAPVGKRQPQCDPKPGPQPDRQRGVDQHPLGYGPARRPASDA